MTHQTKLEEHGKGKDKAQQSATENSNRAKKPKMELYKYGMYDQIKESQNMLGLKRPPQQTP